MTEKELISKIRQLRQIKPRKDWVVFTKKQILSSPTFQEKVELDLGEEIRGQTSVGLNELFEGIRIIFQHKFVFAPLVILIVLVGTFGFAQKSLPGDLLYPVKRIVEKSQAIFVAEKEQPRLTLELANRRLDDLTKIAQNNSVKNLAPAINEYQASVSEVAKSLAKEKDTETVKAIVIEVQKLEEKKQQVESLGAVIGENEDMDEVCAQKIVEILESFIKDLEGRSLTEEQGKGLAEVKKDCQNGNYSEALEKLLLLTQ